MALSRGRRTGRGSRASIAIANIDRLSVCRVIDIHVATGDALNSFKRGLQFRFEPLTLFLREARHVLENLINVHGRKSTQTRERGSVGST